MTIFAAVKHHHQHASIQADEFIINNAGTLDDAVEAAFDYLIAVDNKANEYGNDKLKAELKDDGYFDTGKYRVVIYSSDDFTDKEAIKDTGRMRFEMPHAHARAIAMRKVELHC